jgi:hypothetical protein
MKRGNEQQMGGGPSVRHLPVSQRSRALWQCFGFSIGAVLAVLLAPRWGWIAREQVALTLPTGRAARYMEFEDTNTILPFPPPQAKRADEIAIDVAWAIRDQGLISLETPKHVSIGLANRAARDARERQFMPRVNNAGFLSEIPGVWTSSGRYVVLAHNAGRPHSMNYNKHTHLAGLDDLRDLMRCYPDSGLPCAAFLRLAFASLLRNDRPLPLNGTFYILSFASDVDAENDHDVSVNGPEIVADALAAAQQGEQADPTNAFFPLMQCMIHQIVHQDAAACADLDRAARKTRWDDYTMALTHGRWSYNDIVFGLHDSQTRSLALRQEPLLPQSGLLHTAQLLTWQAVSEERAEQAQAGIALRARLMRVGALMRDQATSGMGPLTGTMIIEIAQCGPEGRGLRTSGRVDDAVIVDQNGKGARQRHGAYLRFLSKHHANQEMTWTTHMLAGQKYIVSPSEYIVNAHALWVNGIIETVWPVMCPYPVLFVQWEGGILLMMACTTVGLIGGFVVLQDYRRRFAGAAPRMLSNSVVGGSALACVMAVCVLAFCIEQVPNPFALPFFELLLPLLMIGLLLPLLGVFPSTRLLVKAYLVTLFGLLGLIVLLMWEAHGIVALNKIVNPNAYMGSGSVGIYLFEAGITTTVVLLLPALVAFICAIVSRVRCVPVAAGMVHGFNVLSLPILTLLLLGYAALTFSTARYELLTQRDMELIITPPGAYATYTK